MVEEVEGAYWFGPICMSVNPSVGKSVTSFTCFETSDSLELGTRNFMYYLLFFLGGGGGGGWWSDLLLQAADTDPSPSPLPPPLPFPPTPKKIIFFQIWILCQNLLTPLELWTPPPQPPTAPLLASNSPPPPTPPPPAEKKDNFFQIWILCQNSHSKGPGKVRKFEDCQENL